MKKTKLKKGARFVARWRDTDYFYWSTLVEPAGEDWRIRFDDGTLAVVKKYDLHESPPIEARNRVTRHSPTKSRKRREEESRKSPDKKVRKLFTEEDNVKLGKGLTDIKAPKIASGVGEENVAIDISVPMEVLEISSSEEKLTGVGERSSNFLRRSVSITRDREDPPRFGEGSSNFLRRSVSVTRDREDPPRAADAPQLTFKSVSMAKEPENEIHGSSDESSSLHSRSIRVEVQKRTVAHSDTGYLESHRRNLWTDYSAGPAVSRPSPLTGPDDLAKQKGIMKDARLPESYQGRHLQRQFLQERSLGSSRSTDQNLDMDLRWKSSFGRKFYCSPYRRSVSVTNGSDTNTHGSSRSTDQNLDMDLKWKSSFGREFHSAPYRRSVSITKGCDTNTHGLEMKFLNKFPMEFGGRCGTLLLLIFYPLFIMSVFLFGLVLDPTKFQMAVQNQLQMVLQNQLECFPQLALGIIVFLFIQAILTRVPIGPVTSGPLTRLGISKLRCNGEFAVLFTLTLTAAACYFKRDVPEIVVDMYNEAAVSAMLLGIIFSLILHIRAGKLPLPCLNPYGARGFQWYDFWMGRETTPYIWKFNVKFTLHRFSVITAITLNTLIVTKAYLEGAEEDLLKSLMISTVMQSLFCCHFIFREDIYLYSFLALSEGVGYMITIGLMTFPFMLTFITKAILDYRLKASLTERSIALCAYVIGHLLLESSSYKKTRTVRDPRTSIWKMIVLRRWSNSIQSRAYLGEIIVYWAFAMVAGTTNLGIFILPLAFTISVLSRSIREYTRVRGHKKTEYDSKQ